MIDGAIPYPPVNGANIDTRVESGNNNHRPVVVLGDPSSNSGVAPVSPSFGLGVEIKHIGDSSSLDASRRLRVSSPVGVFENRNIYNLTDEMESVTSGAGASITHLPNESSAVLTTGTVSGEYALHQSYRYFSYVPGKSQSIKITSVIGAGKTNVVKEIGYGDDFNGLFFQQTGTILQINRRTFTSGSVVNNTVDQSNWNIDKLDGTGASGIILDITKVQIFLIDFQWLGVGRIRFGFDIDGIIYYCHQVLNTNNLTTVFMTTGTLPVRFKISNTGITSSSTSLKEICCAIESEGGYVPPGDQFSASSGTTLRNITTRVPIFAIRATSAFLTKQNRKTIRLTGFNVYSDTKDCFVELVHVQNLTGVTATWNTVHTNSSVEYSTDISTLSGVVSPVEHMYLPVGGKAGTILQDINTNNHHLFISQNYASNLSQMFVIYATSLTTITGVAASMTWVESE